MKKAIFITLLPAFLLAGTLQAQTEVHKKHPSKKATKKPTNVRYGIASYYANKFDGRKTYTDEIFSQKKMTAASNTLPMGTWVKITNLRNKKTAIVRINDKMHPRNRRLIDLSLAAAHKLGFAGHGLTRVKLQVLGKKKPAEAEEEETAEKLPK